MREIAPPSDANPSPGPSDLTERGARADGSSTTEPPLRPPSITSRKDGPGRRGGPGSGNGASPYASNEGELSPEERLRLAAFREEQQAIAAPTVIRGSSLLNSPSTSSPSSDALQQYGPFCTLLAGVAKQDPSGQGGQAASPSGQPGSAYDGQNAQAQKESFLRKTRGQVTDNYLKSTRIEPLSRYEIKAGWDIPATLEQAINSDLPGEVKALVRCNVYDTATGSISSFRKAHAWSERIIHQFPTASRACRWFGVDANHFSRWKLGQSGWHERARRGGEEPDSKIGLIITTLGSLGLPCSRAPLRRG